MQKIAALTFVPFMVFMMIAVVGIEVLNRRCIMINLLFRPDVDILWLSYPRTSPLLLYPRVMAIYHRIDGDQFAEKKK